MESLIQENYKLLASALAHLGEGVMITDNNLEKPGPIILYVNPAMCRMSGYCAEELVNQTPRIFQGDGTDKSQLSKLKAELRKGNSTTVELVNYRKSGERFSVELFLSPMYDSSGVCTNYVSVVRDLTERNRLLDTLRSREQHMSAVLDTAVDAILTINARGIIVSANRAAAKMFGYAVEELLGKNVCMLMPAPFRDHHDQYIRNYLETGQPRIIGTGREVAGLRKDGTLFPIDLAVAQVDDSELFTGIIRDLTARRELQRQVLEVAGEQQRLIGHQLQEGVGQDLTGIHLLSHTLMSLIDSRAPTASSSSPGVWLSEQEFKQLRLVASRLSSGVAEAATNVAKLSLGVMPVQLDSKGLAVALRELVANTASGVTGLQCVLHCNRDLEVHSSLAAGHIYRIVREAVDNASSRRAISRIEIHVTASEGELAVSVKDDALHDLVEAENSSSVLLSDIMTYRAGIVGGYLSAERLQPNGHSISLRISSSMLSADH